MGITARLDTPGFGKVSLKETTLTDLLETMLSIPDAWATFAGCYLTALDEVASASASASPWRCGERLLDQRSAALGRWHQMPSVATLPTDPQRPARRPNHLLRNENRVRVGKGPNSAPSEYPHEPVHGRGNIPWWPSGTGRIFRL